jgi:hypothetical protein
VLQRIPDLAARRLERGIALSGTIEGQDIDLAIRPGEEAGQFVLGSLPPLKLDVLDIRTLSSARPGSSEEQAQIERAAAETSGSRRFRGHRIHVGAGGLWVGGDPLAAALSASWQLNLIPVKQFGALGQLPLEVQIQYAPSGALLGALNSGVEASLSPLVPVNVRVIGGIGAGSAQRESPEGTTRRDYIFGPTGGLAVGYERGWFRMDLRYEHLFNLLENSPDVNALFLRLGVAP